MWYRMCLAVLIIDHQRWHTLFVLYLQFLLPFLFSVDLFWSPAKDLYRAGHSIALAMYVSDPNLSHALASWVQFSWRHVRSFDV